MARPGISLKTAICPATSFSAVTTPAEPSTHKSGSLSDPEKKSSSELMQEMQFSFGGLPSTAPIAKRASNARSFATRVRSDRPSLSDRLTQSLITAGLVRGITPSSIRKQSGAAIRDFASLPLDGGAAADQEKACLSLRGYHD